MGHYIYKSIPTAKFEVDSFSSSGDMTSQNFPWKKGTSREISLFTPKTVLTFSKNVFQFQQVSSREKFSHFQNFWDVLMTKEQQQADD